jgi:hypothetical protein
MIPSLPIELDQRHISWAYYMPHASGHGLSERRCHP